MSDVALARNLVAEIAGHCWGGKGDMIDRVYGTIDKHFRDLKVEHAWTRRRIRSFWHQEAAGVRYHEMIELAAVAAAARAERERLEEAKRGHAEFVARTARLATALAVQDEEFHRGAIEAFRRLASPRLDPEIGDVEGGCNEVARVGHRAGGAMGAGDCL